MFDKYLSGVDKEKVNEDIKKLFDFFMSELSYTDDCPELEDICDPVTVECDQACLNYSDEDFQEDNDNYKDYQKCLDNYMEDEGKCFCIDCPKCKPHGKLFDPKDYKGYKAYSDFHYWISNLLEHFEYNEDFKGIIEVFEEFMEHEKLKISINNEYLSLITYLLMIYFHELSNEVTCSDSGKINSKKLDGYCNSCDSYYIGTCTSVPLGTDMMIWNATGINYTFYLNPLSIKVNDEFINLFILINNLFINLVQMKNLNEREIKFINEHPQIIELIRKTLGWSHLTKELKVKALQSTGGK